MAGKHGWLMTYVELADSILLNSMVCWRMLLMSWSGVQRRCIDSSSFW